MQPREARAEEDVAPGSEHDNPVDKPESGVNLDSPPVTPIGRPDPKEPGYQGSSPTDSGETSAEKSRESLTTPQPEPGGHFIQQLDFATQDQAFPGDFEVGGGNGLDGRGDSCRKDGKVPDVGVEAESKLHRARGPRKAHQLSSGSEDVDMPCTSDSSFNYELSINDHLNIFSTSKKQMRKKMGLKRELMDHCEDEVEECPVSGLRYMEGDSTPRPVRGQPHLRLWVEPADSGFLDMVSSAPAGKSNAAPPHLPLPPLQKKKEKKNKHEKT